MSNHLKKENKHNLKMNQSAANDLTLPILCVIVLLPFIVYFKSDLSGLAQYEWHGIDDTVTDFYLYYKSRIFIIICGISLLILTFRLPLYRENTKRLKPFLPLLIYSVIVIISALGSIAPDLTLNGAPYMYENVWVLLGYTVICFYTYQIIEKENDYLILHKGILILLFIMIFLGILQLFGKDIVNFEPIQKLLMNKQDETLYLGQFVDVFTKNYVYLTLFNPNYAGHFLSMMCTYIFAIIMTEKHQKKKWFYIIIEILLLLLLWFTYARAALVALFIGISAVCLKGKFYRNKKAIFTLCGSFCCIICIAVLIDSFNNFHFFKRMIDQKEELPLESIVTYDDHILIQYDGKTQVIDNLEEGDIRTVTLDERDWHFIKENNVYRYINEFGRYDEIPIIAKADFGGYEYLGSGRLYIWSRILPLLPRYFWFGSGPDTFLPAFPQDDYVGKHNYCHSVTTYVEKAHNGYLMSALQTGIPGILCLLVFSIVVLLRYIRYDKSVPLTDSQVHIIMSFKSRMRLAVFGAIIAYLTGLFFNDSTLATTPIACVFFGLLAISEKDSEPKQKQS